MKKETKLNLLATVAIFVLIGWAASGEVGEQVANPKAPKSYYPMKEQLIQQDTTICPDCLEKNCIYKEINDNCEDATDSSIYDAILKVCKKRGITNPKSIDTLLREYYL